MLSVDRVSGGIAVSTKKTMPAEGESGGVALSESPIFLFAETDNGDISSDDNSAAVAEPERDLRVEKWSRRGKDGKLYRYWQWANRNTKFAGKKGGKKWRSYGGSIAQDGALIESRRRRSKPV